MLVRPQTPHAPVVTNGRLVASRAASASGPSSMRTVSSSSCSSDRMSSGRFTTPSEKRNPAARARSSPGVRMVVETTRTEPPMRARNSSGRSTATQSSAEESCPPRTRNTDACSDFDIAQIL